MLVQNTEKGTAASTSRSLESRQSENGSEGAVGNDFPTAVCRANADGWVGVGSRQSVHR
jgi:hypothetical protein